MRARADLDSIPAQEPELGIRGGWIWGAGTDGAAAGVGALVVDAGGVVGVGAGVGAGVGVAADAPEDAGAGTAAALEPALPALAAEPVLPAAGAAGLAVAAGVLVC